MKKLAIIIISLLFAGHLNAQKPRASDGKVYHKHKFTGVAKSPTDTLIPGNYLNASGVTLLMSPGGGYVCGTNEYGDRAKGQQFKVTQSYKIEGALFWFGAKKVGSSDTLYFKIWRMDDNAGCTMAGQNQKSPGSVIDSVKVAVSAIDTSSDFSGAYYVAFSSPVIVYDDYVIGFEMNNTSTDTVGLFSTVDSSGAEGDLCWEMWGNGQWATFLCTGSWGNDVDMCIFPVVDLSSMSVGDNIDFFGMRLSQSYPNPVAGECRISYELINNTKNLSLSVMDINGRIIKQINLGDKTAGKHELTLDLSGFSAGVYFYSLNAGGKKLVKKLTIIQ